MAVYGLSGGRRDDDVEGKGAQLFLGLGNFLLHWFMWAVDPLVTLSLRLHLSPDFYNYAGLIFGVAGGVFVALGDFEWGGWAIAFCGISDILDGRIARKTGVASAYGDFIDSTFDRFVEVFVYLGFLIALRGMAWGPFAAAAAMAGSLLVSYTRARGEVLGVMCTGGLMQRGERLVLTFLVCLADPYLTAYLGHPPGTAALWVLAFIAVTTFLTAIHRTVWIAARLR